MKNPPQPGNISICNTRLGEGAAHNTVTSSPTTKDNWESMSPLIPPQKKTQKQHTLKYCLQDLCLEVLTAPV